MILNAAAVELYCMSVKILHEKLHGFKHSNIQTQHHDLAPHLCCPGVSSLPVFLRFWPRQSLVLHVHRHKQPYRPWQEQLYAPAALVSIPSHQADEGSAAGVFHKTGWRFNHGIVFLTRSIQRAPHTASSSQPAHTQQHQAQLRPNALFRA